jgi:hypothetical protein
MIGQGFERRRELATNLNETRSVYMLYARTRIMQKEILDIH